MRLGEFRGQLEAVEAAARQSRVPIERAFRAPASRVRALLRRSPELASAVRVGSTGPKPPGAAVPWGRAERGNGRRVERRWAPTARVRVGSLAAQADGAAHTAEPGTAHRAWPHRPEHWSERDAKAAAFLRVAGVAAACRRAAGEPAAWARSRTAAGPVGAVRPGAQAHAAWIRVLRAGSAIRSAGR